MDKGLDVTHSVGLPSEGQHHHQMFKTLWAMRKNKELCDVQFVISGSCFWAHSVIVSACSPYLRKYFKDSVEEKDHNGHARLEVESYSKSVLFEMIEYMYTGKSVTLTGAEQIEFVKLLKEWQVDIGIGANSVQNKENPIIYPVIDDIYLRNSDQDEQYYESHLTEYHTDASGTESLKTKDESLATKIAGRNKPINEKAHQLEKQRPKRGRKRKHVAPQRCFPKDKVTDVTLAVKPIQVHVKEEILTSQDESKEIKRRKVGRPRKNVLTFEISRPLRKRKSKAKDSEPTHEKKKKIYNEKDHKSTDHSSMGSGRRKLYKKTFESLEKKKAYCKFCDKYLTQQHYLPFHMWKFHYTEGMPEPKLFVCEYPGCKQAFRGQVYLKEHADNVHSTERSICCVCGKTFKNEKGVKHHMKSQHDLPAPIKPRKSKSKTSIKCEESDCGKTFSLKSSYEAHMDRHRGVKLICELCGYSCGYKESMRSHKYKIHNIEPPEGLLYKCKFCDHKTCFISGMKSHEKRHSSEKPFQCEKCSRCFKSNMELINHNRNIHERSNYVCKYCSRTFSVKNNLKLHVRNQHEQKHVKAFACEICGYRSNLKGNLNHHLRNVHKIQVQTKYKVPEIQNKDKLNVKSVNSDKTITTPESNKKQRNAEHPEIQNVPSAYDTQNSATDLASFDDGNRGEKIDINMTRVEVQSKGDVNQFNALHNAQDDVIDSSTLWTARDSVKVPQLYTGSLGPHIESNDSSGGLITSHTSSNERRNSFSDQQFSYF